MEVWLGYRSGRVYLAEQFHDGKISEEDFRTKLALIGKQAFDDAERPAGTLGTLAAIYSSSFDR